MVSLIITFLRHYIFCFLGASLRFLWDLIIVKLNNKRHNIRFKDYHNYDEHPESEMLDAIIGFIIFGVMIGIFIKVTDRHGW
jgi:hypothetical protein